MFEFAAQDHSYAAADILTPLESIPSGRLQTASNCHYAKYCIFAIYAPILTTGGFHIKASDNMIFTDFRTADPSLRESAWDIYFDSFPEYERRSRRAHDMALEHGQFHPTVVHDGEGRALGIVFYWLHENMLFVEHIAVNPEVRGQNVGSSIMKELFSRHPERIVMLEIEPPADEITTRRKVFYERLGFVPNGFYYVHPSFATGEKAVPHELVIMSRGRKLTGEEFASFRELLRSTLMRYVD